MLSNIYYIIHYILHYITHTTRETMISCIAGKLFFGWVSYLFMFVKCAGHHLWFYDWGRLERVEISSLGVGVRVKEGDADKDRDFSLPTPPPFPWLASTSLGFLEYSIRQFWHGDFENKKSCTQWKASNAGLNNDETILNKIVTVILRTVQNRVLTIDSKYFYIFCRLPGEDR